VVPALSGQKQIGSVAVRAPLRIVLVPLPHQVAIGAREGDLSSVAHPVPKFVRCREPLTGPWGLGVHCNDSPITGSENPRFRTFEGFVDDRRPAVLGDSLDDDFRRVGDSQLVLGSLRWPVTALANPLPPLRWVWIPEPAAGRQPAFQAVTNCRKRLGDQTMKFARDQDRPDAVRQGSPTLKIPLSERLVRRKDWSGGRGSWPNLWPHAKRRPAPSGNALKQLS
jgi:hypothetical protein